MSSLETVPEEIAADEALERLAALIPSAWYATALTGGESRVPLLTVVNRRASRLTGSVYYRRGWYWWSWAERIAPGTDVEQAARKVANTLAVTPRRESAYPMLP